MCKKFWNETVRSTWDEGTNSTDAQAERDRAAAAAAQAAAQAAARAEEDRRNQESQDRILAEAKENDRRRGRRATVISGVTGDPNFGSGVVAKQPYALGTRSTKLGA